MARPGSTASTSRLALEAWEAMFRAQATLAREFEYARIWSDVSPREYGVLYALSGEQDGLRITALTDDVLLSQAGVSRLVARLEERGMVERRDDPEDARACRIVLTAEGREAQRRLGRLHAQHVTEAMTRALGTQELETLRELGRALVAAAPPTTPAGKGPTKQP
jgi:DNA-binding MarR family transcriptional regulator